MMAAVVLGTALTAMSADGAQASDAPPRAVGDIGRYCTSCWRNARLPVDAWADCTQEVYRRLLERVPASRWEMALKAEGDERREFLRAIDAVKKRCQRSRKWAPLNEDVHDRQGGRSGIELADRREQLNKAAAEVLSDRQRRIVQMSLEGYSVQEVADALTMSPERVSDEKYKAIRKLRREVGMEAQA
jgi:RNA polymerase sigma factor (sigma-70 family)